MLFIRWCDVHINGAINRAIVENARKNTSDWTNSAAGPVSGHQHQQRTSIGRVVKKLYSRFKLTPYTGKPRWRGCLSPRPYWMYVRRREGPLHFRLATYAPRTRAHFTQRHRPLGHLGLCYFEFELGRRAVCSVR